MTTLADRREQYSEHIKKQSEIVEVNFRLMMAIIEVESAFDTYAVRYEPYALLSSKPKVFATLNNITEATERTLQRLSWGMGQILGCTARSIGMKGPLTSLCDIDTGVFWSAMYLKRVSEKYMLLPDQIAAYNAGTPRKDINGRYSNQGYVDKVRNILHA